MAFPFEFEGNFEVGDASEFTALVGTQVAVEHFTELARSRAVGVPFRGAYALKATFGVDTDSYVRSTTITIGSDAIGHARFMFYIGSDVSATADTEVTLYTTVPAAGAFGLRIEAGGDIFFGAASNGSALTLGTPALERGRWYTAELETDTGNGDDVIARLDNGPSATIVNGVATGATTEGRLGIQGIGAGAMTALAGSITLDELVTDDTNRVFGLEERYPHHRLLTKTTHLFVGAGTIEAVQLIAGAGTDCELNIYDTQTADTNPLNLKFRITNNTSAETRDYNGRSDMKFSKGAYITLSGTTPQAVVTIGIASSYGSEANVRRLVIR